MGNWRYAAANLKIRMMSSCFETRDAKHHSITDCAVWIGTSVLSIIEKTGESCGNRAKTDHGVGGPECKLHRRNGRVGTGCFGLADAYSAWFTYVGVPTGGFRW